MKNHLKKLKETKNKYFRSNKWICWWVTVAHFPTSSLLEARRPVALAPSISFPLVYGNTFAISIKLPSDPTHSNVSILNSRTTCRVLINHWYGFLHTHTVCRFVNFAVWDCVRIKIRRRSWATQEETLCSFLWRFMVRN